jgi:hypothetical protein
MPDKQPLANRISALDSSSAHYALYSLAYSPDPADQDSLSAALDAAEQWAAELTAVRVHT